ncbi:MAG: carboxypeptidase-like regulatory domain-containing protein [Pseudomonadota bacterium]
MRVLLRVPLLCLLLISGCDSAEVVEWPAKKGQVIDEMTGEGIADAIVVARWKGTAAYSTTVCFHVESTTTDKRGRYEIPAWQNDTRWRNTGYQHVVIKVYKVGYLESDKTYKSRKNVDGKYLLKSFHGEVTNRLEYLLRLSGVVSCGSKDGSENNLIPVFRAIYSEANSLSANEGEGIVESILYDLEIIEYGFNVAGKRHYERIKK